MADSTVARAHLNLVDSSHRLFELDPGAVVEKDGGAMLGAGSSSHPSISNAVFRTDDGLEPSELIARARDFFGKRGRGFCVWTRAGRDEDADLIAATVEAGMTNLFEMPEMVLRGRTGELDLPADVEIRRLTDERDAAAYWRVAAESYADLGFPAEAFSHYTDGARMLGDGIVPLIAEREGEAVAISMSIVSHGIAGIYWVGALGSARGLGLGRAVTAAAGNAGLDLGADIASLQASPMGRPIYEAMGYESIYDYRLMLSPAP